MGLIAESSILSASVFLTALLALVLLKVCSFVLKRKLTSEHQNNTTEVIDMTKTNAQTNTRAILAYSLLETLWAVGTAGVLGALSA